MKIHLCLFIMLAQYCFAQSPKPFKICGKTINYTVDDWVLRKKVGMDLNIPASNPSYDGGVKELEKFFKANSIDDSIYMFRTLISFVVNCKGQLGDFQLMNNEKDLLQEQVLEIVKKMPRKWKPAISKEGKPVDSYQIITVTVRGSEFLNAEYK